MGHNYGKIPVIFKREPKAKFLTEGAFANSYFETLKDLKWIGTEKIDGSNLSLKWDSDKVTVQGHMSESKFQPSQLEFFKQTFETPEFEELMEQNFGMKPVTIYGENYGGDIMKVGKQYSESIRFIVFDVGFPTENGELFARREVVEEIAKNLGLDVAPIMKEGTLMELVEYVKTKPTSPTAAKYGNNDLVIEGLVARPCLELKDQKGERIITKIKVRDFC